jgi:hypothetical protein
VPVTFYTWIPSTSDVVKIFNPDAFIWCDTSQFPSTATIDGADSEHSSNSEALLQACAARVQEVEQVSGLQV